MIIGHFTPSYTPICAGQSAQILREDATLHGRLGYDYRWWSEEQSNIDALRNRNLRAAIDMGCDYLLMQDSDIWSKSNIGAIAPLLTTARETGAAAVAAIVGLRREHAQANVQPVQAGEVYKAEKAGTGLMLIDCKQAAEIANGRWFVTTLNEDGTQIKEGEDIHFCRLIREAGRELWVDGRVPTTHVRKDIWTLDYPGHHANGERKSPDEGEQAA